MQISPHFTYNELTYTNHNQFLFRNRKYGEKYIGNMRLLCNYVLEPIRELVSAPIIITSCFRFPDLNEYVGSKLTSQHPLGLAADFKVKGIDLRKAFDRISLSNLKWGQLIFETKNNTSWIHGSTASLARNGQVLIFENGSYRRIK